MPDSHRLPWTIIAVYGLHRNNRPGFVKRQWNLYCETTSLYNDEAAVHAGLTVSGYATVELKASGFIRHKLYRL